MPFDLAGSLAAASRQHAEGCVKTEEDLARYRAVIARARPDGIIETGTFSGKSALWFARNAGVPVWTVDVHSQVDAATQEAWWVHKVTGHIGSSTSPKAGWEVLEWMMRWNVHRPLVVLDSDHSADTVLNEMHLYGRLVQPGGYMVVEDGLVRWMPHEWKENGGPYEGSPLDAIERFLAGTDAWEVDAEIEGMSDITQFPSGWLRRR